MRLFVSPVAALLALGLAWHARAASMVTLTPSLGHPGLPVAIAGTGFGNAEAVDVSVDTLDTLLLVSSASGALSGTVTIPASAGPGAHTITAVGRHTGDAAQSVFTVATYWAQYGFGTAHQSWNPYENTLSRATVPALGLLWSSAINTGGGTPAVISNRMYVSSLTNGVEAITPATGAVVWRKVVSDPFYGSPVVVAGVVHIGSVFGNVYALKASNGALLWSVQLGGTFYGSPVVAGGTVYIGGSNGTMYALQASTGAIRWSFGTGDTIESSPAVVAGRVYFGSNDNHVYALDAGTGNLVWLYATGGPVESTPSVVDNVLYVGSDDGKVYAITTDDARGGLLLWSFATGAAVPANPAVANGTVFAGAMSALFALDAHTGVQQWKLVTGGEVRSPAVANGVVYVTSDDGRFYGLDAGNGAVLSVAAATGTLFGSPSIADGVVYVADYGGSLFAFASGAGTNAVVAGARSPSLASLRPDVRLGVTH